MHDVVTAFLYNGRHVLLARRSEAVSTFPGHWAAISGYVEQEPPLHRAVIEVEEETAISPGELLLAGIGEPLLAGNELTFRVHPFLFLVAADCQPRRDWEAERFQWTAVEDVLDERIQPTVPRLAGALRNVWPPWPAERVFDENVKWFAEWLSSDRRHGATALAVEAGRAWRSLCRTIAPARFRAARARLAQVAHEWGSVRPAMVAVGNLLADLAEDGKRADAPRVAVDRVDRRLAQIAQAQQRAATSVADAIRPGTSAMVISYSCLVRNSLLAARNKLRHVYVSEGRPLFEGRELARELAAAGVRVSLLTEAQVYLHVPHVDLILLGADALLPNGEVINKTGSRILATAGREFGKPVWVVTIEIKKVRPSLSTGLPQEAMPADEVWTGAPPGIEIVNLYFEPVPSSLIDRVITEAGNAAASGSP